MNTDVLFDKKYNPFILHGEGMFILIPLSNQYKYLFAFKYYPAGEGAGAGEGEGAGTGAGAGAGAGLRQHYIQILRL